jgi:hypothetical protein
MTTTLWLPISSVVSFLYAAGHAMGGRLSWSLSASLAVAFFLAR